MASDEFSTVYLGNILTKLKKRRAQVESDFICNEKGLEGLAKLYETYQVNPLHGDPDQVREVTIFIVRNSTFRKFLIFPVNLYY